LDDVHGFGAGFGEESAGVDHDDVGFGLDVGQGAAGFCELVEHFFRIDEILRAAKRYERYGFAFRHDGYRPGDAACWLMPWISDGRNNPSRTTAFSVVQRAGATRSPVFLEVAGFQPLGIVWVRRRLSKSGEDGSNWPDAGLERRMTMMETGELADGDKWRLER